MKFRHKVLMIVIVCIIGGTVWGASIFQGELGNIHGKVKAAGVNIEKVISIDLGELNSGEEFYEEKTFANALNIENATKLKVILNLSGIEEEKRENAFQQGYVNVVIGDRHSDGTWDEYINVTLNMLAPQEVVGGEIEGNHEYDVKLRLYGIAGYPSEDVDIDFNVLLRVMPP